jgi:polyferredoxin
MAWRVPYQVLADVVLAVHFAVVVFVVGGLAAIVAGHWRGWRFVDALSFRAAHLAAIAIVAAQAWLGVVCPLTTLESWLRSRANEGVYRAGFVEYWLERALYYDAPAWVFTLAYSLFAAAVAAVWWRWPPRRRGS